MGGLNWKTIDVVKLEVEIGKCEAQYNEAARGALATKDVAVAIRASSLAATHNALVAVRNSLQ